MTLPAIAYLGDSLVGSADDVHNGTPHWAFALGGHDYNRALLLQETNRWLKANDFYGYAAVEHKNNLFVTKVWVDFFVASEAARFRLHHPCPTYTMDRMDELHAKLK